MKKFYLLICGILWFQGINYSQTINTSKLQLEGIAFDLQINNLPDSLQAVNVIISGENFKEKYLLLAKNSKVDTSIKYR